MRSNISTDDEQQEQQEQQETRKRSTLNSPATTFRTSTTPSRPFQRFDPTAYQREKERKQLTQSRRLTSRSPSQNRHLVQQKHLSTKGRRLDYASDSGYSSADSNASRRSTRSSRARQRQVDDRLSSPKYRVQPQQEDPSASRSRTTTTPSRHLGAKLNNITSNGRSLHQVVAPPPAPTSSGPKSRGQTFQGTTTSFTGSKTTKPVQVDASMDSLSDIDERLGALQQFLKEAKKNTSTHVTTTKVPS
jgi:hypothetical protein